MNRRLHAACLVLIWVSLFLVTCVKRLTRPLLQERHGLAFDATHNDDRSPMGGRRALAPILDNVASESDYDVAFAAAYAEAGEPPKQTPMPPSEPYVLEDAVREADSFENTFALLVYDPPSDRFVGLYSDDHSWGQSNEKLFMTMKSLAYLLRRLFPERFTPSSSELILAVASGDYPQVKLSALPHSGLAPVLMFGSSFRDEGLYPNMVAMPMPDAYHLLCFQQWVSAGTVCRKFEPNKHEHGETVGLEFGEENGLEWDDLIVS